MRSNAVGTTVLLLMAVAALGCGGSGGSGGDGGGGGGGGGMSAVCISYAGSAPASGAANTAKGSGSVCNTVVVDVLLTDVTDVFTVAFDVTFDPDVARYDGHSVAGSHMSSDGAAVDVIETKSAGHVHLGVTRLNPAVGIDFTGSHNVIQLMFGKPSGAGAGDVAALTFSSTQVFGSEQPPVEKSGIAWPGGTFTIN